MADVLVYTKDNCGYCVHAKNLLDSKHIAYTEIHIDHDDKLRDEMIRLSGRRTVPQIFINGQPIGGYDDLAALAKAGKLDDLLR
jgi:glutaredoxin 3